jgi:hypothetical protein
VICRFAARNRAVGAVLPISFMAEEHDYLGACAMAIQKRTLSSLLRYVAG